MKKVVLIAILVLCALGVHLQEGLAQAAGEGHLGFSFSTPADLSGKVISREEILCFDENLGSRLLFSNEGLACMIGDLDGDGNEDFPANIDALHVESMAGAASASSMFLSTTSNECGVLDGDLFHFNETGGIEIHLAESYFVTAVGATDGNVDVDAFTRTPGGDLYFSFADNEGSSLLSGSQPGMILDGAILHVDSLGTASVHYTEDEVSAMLSQALGKSYKAVDVLGLSYDWVNDCLLFSVQSPSSHDGSVFSDAGGGALVPGYDEPSLGFANAVELDGLSLLPLLHDMMAMEVEPRYPWQKATTTFTITGGKANMPFYLLVSGALSPVSNPYSFGGFGSLMLDMNDLLFHVGCNFFPLFTGFYDWAGVGVYTVDMPDDPQVMDFHLQAADPLTGILSHPLTVELNQ